MENIEHDGIVKEVHPKELLISIVAKSACVSCQIKTVCNPSDSKEKIFYVKMNDTSKFSVGDRVKLSISEGKGMLAVLLGFITPLVLLLSVFFIFNSMGIAEPLSALYGVATAGVYYLCLYLFRNSTAQRFAFTVTPYED